MNKFGPHLLCAVCSEIIKEEVYYKCMHCNNRLHLGCLYGATTVNQLDPMAPSCICHECTCKIPKGGHNTNTPVRVTSGKDYQYESERNKPINPEKTCVGCKQTIVTNQFLRCSCCMSFYDLECANVSENRFYNTLTREHREKWRCTRCIHEPSGYEKNSIPVHTVDERVTVRRGAAFSTSSDQMDVSVAEPINSTALDATMEMSYSGALITEMRLFREELTATRLQMGVLNGTMSKLVSRMDACETRVTKMDERIDTLERRLQDGTTATYTTDRSLLATVEQLRADINERDQELLINDVEISGIPEYAAESLPHIVTALASKLGVNIGEQDIVSTKRAGPAQDSEGPTPARPRSLVVRLARRAMRDALLQAARVRRGATTEGTGLPGAPRRFYVNE